MKRSLFLLLIVIIFLTGLAVSGCRESGLNGTYEGTLPAADCPGLITLITLNPDGTFYMEETFIERDDEPRITNGKWVLNGDIIEFTVEDYNFEYKLISENEIRWAPGGEEITGTDLNWSLFKK